MATSIAPDTTEAMPWPPRNTTDHDTTDHDTTDHDTTDHDTTDHDTTDLARTAKERCTEQSCDKTAVVPAKAGTQCRCRRFPMHTALDGVRGNLRNAPRVHSTE
jgi:hypothetical protein